MTVQELKATINHPKPPEKLSPLLQSLWYDAKGDWESAHNIAQDINSDDGSWVHAYLHRKEGDNGNASYWYHRAKRQMPAYTLEKEWEEIAAYFLKNE
jgi:hypothetical protein